MTQTPFSPSPKPRPQTLNPQPPPPTRLFPERGPTTLLNFKVVSLQVVSLRLLERVRGDPGDCCWPKWTRSWERPLLLPTRPPAIGNLLQNNHVSAAHATHCATFCTPCQPLLRAFSRWIRSPPPSNTAAKHTPPPRLCLRRAQRSLVLFLPKLLPVPMRKILHDTSSSFPFRREADSVSFQVRASKKLQCFCAGKPRKVDIRLPGKGN